MRTRIFYLNHVVTPDLTMTCHYHAEDLIRLDQRASCYLIMEGS